MLKQTVTTRQTKPDAPTPAVIVFGLDDNQRPHASWLPEADLPLAEKAAGLMNKQVLRVTTAEYRAAASALAAGRVFASGKGFVPFCAKGAYERLTAFEGAFQPEPPASTSAPQPANVPVAWSEIGLDSLGASRPNRPSGHWTSRSPSKRQRLRPSANWTPS